MTEEISMKTIQHKLDHIKTEVITDMDVAYLRWKCPLMTSGSDIMRIYKNLKIAIKKHGAKIPFDSFLNLNKMLTIVGKEFLRVRIPEEYRRDDFKKWETGEKKFF